MRRITSEKIHLVIVGDGDIADLNRRFLKRAGPTDVIAFPGEDAFMGEIVISSDTARRQARERRVPLALEMTLLAVHGMLHLVGYDDTNRAQWKTMKQAEFETMMEIL